MKMRVAPFVFINCIAAQEPRSPGEGACEEPKRIVFLRINERRASEAEALFSVGIGLW